MLCSKLATRKDGFQFPCGQCLNCRVNRRRDWQSRLLLEAASHKYAAFVTLTFEDRGIRTILRRSDVKWFLRQLRFHHPSIRHFTAAEYGDKFGRAHYHSALFSDTPILDDHLRESWPFGTVDIGNVEPSSLDYMLGYILKDKKEHPWLVESRYPEFRSFSPGMGKFALTHLLIDGCTLPREFRVFNRLWPIGRYLRDRAKKMGYDVSQTDTKKLEEYDAQVMRAMLQNPSLSLADTQKIYDEFWKKQDEKKKLIQQKAIRAAYLQRHGHVKGRVKSETF